MTKFKHEHHHEGDTAAQDLVVEINRPVAEPGSDEPGGSVPVLGRNAQGLIVVRDEGAESDEDVEILPDE
jgi:hypothetical protein